MVGHLKMHEAFSSIAYFHLIVWTADQGGIAIEVCLFVPNMLLISWFAAFEHFQTGCFGAVLCMSCAWQVY